MKLLLTSAGITNQSIANALLDLVGKDAKDVKIGFVPTAINVEEGHKGWYGDQIINAQKHGFKWIDIIDISASGVDWKRRLAEMDVILVSGGNTFHLLDQMRKVGFGEWFQTVADRIVYVGISAGSIVTTPTIAIAEVEPPDTNTPGLTDLTGLRFVDFEISPHTPEHISYESAEKYAQGISNDLYALDDQSAIKVADDKIEVVSEGKWTKY